MQSPGERGAAEAASPVSPPQSVLTALTQAPLGIAIFDHEMRYLAASSRYLTDQGLPGDVSLVGRLHYEVFPEVPQKWRELHAQALKDGQERRHEADPFVDKNGQVAWIRWSMTPWRTDKGQVGGLVLYTEVVTAQVEARLNLEAAEARYRAVFDQAAMGVARVSLEGRVLEVNDRFCTITRYSRDELLALTFQELTHPDDLEGELAQVRALLQGEAATFSTDKRYLTASGDTVWVSLTASLVRTAEGEPNCFVVIVDDIASRKAAETEQQRYQSQLRLMINELNHRVKNTLATVQSMAAQTLRGEPDPAVAYEKFEARLLGLSDVHGVLTRENWHGANLQEVADRALLPFTGEDPDQIRLHGPAVRLRPGAALTLALVFHELATNAVKYGALSTPNGRVELSWTWDGGNQALRLVWTESGGPRVKPPTRRGFGSRLIERGLSGELQGAATTTYAQSGLVCVMQAQLLPRAEASEFFGGAAED